MNGLVTAVDIADDLNISEQTVYNWTKRYKDFPAPKQVYRRTKLYDYIEVLDFLASKDLPDRTRTIRD